MKKWISCLLLMMIAASAAVAETSRLAEEFKNPPVSVKPHVLWYWINGNISREGLTADLVAMQQAGIGGAMIFNIGGHGPKGPVTVLSPEWRDLMSHAIREAGRLGIEITLNNSMAGWSSSGGPWITPEMAMQKVSWSATRVTGGDAASAKLLLPQPATNLDTYRDCGVVAFPTPLAELEAQKPTVTASDPSVNLQSLLGEEVYTGGSNWDDNVQKLWKKVNPVRFTAKADAAVSIQWAFETPFSARSLHLSFFRKGCTGTLQSSDDGTTWRDIKKLRQRHFESINTVFKAPPARFWRVTFEKGKEVTLTALKLNASYRVENWTAKAMFDSYGLDRPSFTASKQEAPADCVIKSDTILNLTDKLSSDGTLNWSIPKGNWTILRFGYTPTGSKVGPAGAMGGGGLECDKFNPAALDLHFKKSIQPWLDDKELNSIIKTVHIDSYERGGQNWSTALPTEFLSRTGYDITTYLPALTGRVIDSVRNSEQFLWDFRKTTIGMMHENYFGHMQALCAKEGKDFSLEAYHQEQFDALAAAGQATIPTCEVWHGGESIPSSWWMKRAASPAHLYGRQLVGCEAFTARANYSADFWSMKELGDAMFCGGVNRMMLHVYVHQPWMNQSPGQTLAVFGTHFERSNTWWNQMPAFTDYIGRCQQLLQQGTIVADVLYSCGENSPNKSIGPGGSTALPVGYDYDMCDPYVIMNRITVKNGRYTLPDGISYSLLVLPDETLMTPQMLTKIGEFLKAGATIVAPKPVGSPSLSGQPTANQQVQKQADALWETYGQQIFWNTSVAAVLKKVAKPDVTVNPAVPFRYIHKTIEGEDVYFVASASSKPVRTAATFRVSQGKPQLWNPLTGEIRALPDYTQTETETVIPLEFDAHEAYFVIFTKAERSIAKKNFPTYKTVAEISGAWSVEFDAEWGGPESPVIFQTLEDWTQRPEEGIKYYSGTATYRKTFDLPKGIKKGERLFLNLGKFKNVAEVRINGKDAGIVWCAPWQVEITDLVGSKGNKLEIDIVNLWVNRLLGDEQLPEDVKYSTGVWHLIQEWPKWLTDPETPRTSGRYTFTTFNHWNEDKKNSPLLPSGLFGPVTLQGMGK
mgnify:FL=1|tara:strand:- start:1753 stop:5028 length:3276 start_codon:yes stop_codon:yes gene_type:complete